MKLRWKVYFAVFAGLTLLGWGGMATDPGKQTLVSLINVVPEAILLVGLFGYAFGVRIGTPLVWRTVAALAALSIVVCAAWLTYATFNHVRQATVGTSVVAMGIVALLLFPAVVAMLGYADWLAVAKRSSGERLAASAASPSQGLT